MTGRPHQAAEQTTLRSLRPAAAARAQMLLPSHHRRAPPRRGGRRPRGGIAELASRLVGCFLLLLALVAAVLCLSSSSSRARSRRQHEEGGSGATPRVTIFSAPRLTPEGSQARQELAVRSWLALPGNVSVVLLGAHASSLAVAGRLGRRVTVDAAIDSSYAFPAPLTS